MDDEYFPSPIIPRMVPTTSSEMVPTTSTELLETCGNWTAASFISCHEGWKLPIVCLIALVIAGTIFGNTLTLAAITNSKALRTTANLLVVSLAIADLTVAIGVMPLSLVKEVSGTFGSPLCDIWVSLDVLCCTASILNLCLISLDRYWSIAHPFTYNRWRTPKRMLLMIGSIWVFATAISVAPLFGWKPPNDEPTPSCRVSQDKYYTIFSTFGAFFIPMTIMLVVYWLIFLEARRRIRGKTFAKYTADTSLCGITDGSGGRTETADGTFQVRSTTALGKYTGQLATPLVDRLEAVRKLPPPESINPNPTLLNDGESKSLPADHRWKRALSLPAPSKVSPHFAALRKFQAEKQAIATAREHRAAKTLAVVTGLFLVCWLPFFSLALLAPFCSSCQIPRWIESLVLWLGYCNSMLNPLVYTNFNPEFRKAFHGTLRCK